MKKYKVIYVDPPWEFFTKKPHGDRPGSEDHYGKLTLDELKSIDISHLIDERGCFLFMWTTNIILPWSLELMKHWGFTYRSKLTWVKPVMGLGYYFRSASEDLLVGKIGKGTFRFKSQPSWLMAPRQEHSRKPEEVYSIIERVADGPYLEMFARSKREGWDIWGNELPSDIELSVENRGDSKQKTEYEFTTHKK